MLSYRHAFHAGNNADILKHWVIERVLAYMVQKDKPLHYIDTHAGCGLYDLTTETANKTAEYLHGSARLEVVADAPEAFLPYLKLLETFAPFYPGSPSVAARCLRPFDELSLCELHPQDCPELVTHFKKDRRAKIYQEDGFKKVVALMPPKQKRAFIVIDPSYEIKNDYEKVVAIIKEIHKRFSGAVVALWYPVVDIQRIQKLATGIKKIGAKNTLQIELRTRAQSAGGMAASGMFILNAPWTLTDQANEVMPWLSEILAEDDSAGFQVVQLTEG